MLHREPLLTVEARQRTLAEVQRLRRFWRRRHPRLPSFTLGAASYLDVPESGLQGYFAATVRTRARLAQAFQALYEQVRSALANHVGGDAVAYHPTLAGPGFHIFEAHPDIGTLNPKLHFDLQHQHFDWADPAFDTPGRRLSFTVVIDLPASGGGLWIWPITRFDVDRLDADRQQALLERTAPERVSYALGELIIHSGDHLHQIDRSEALRPGDGRVTLQGHGLKEGDRWWLYW